MKLHEWAVVHVKHKDAFAKALQDVNEQGDVITFTFAGYVLTAHICEALSVPDIEGKTLIVTLHTKENVQFLIDNWQSFVQDDVTVTFAHPGRNEQWSIKPALHDRISGENVEQGVWSMASGVSHV